jgi:transcriptional regulator
MYTPAHFVEDRAEVLHALIAEHPLATLVVAGPEGLEATHIPMLFEDGVLRGHVARTNPLAGMAGRAALAIFQGPQRYISPGWYETKKTDGRVVPTWNYIAVHAHGVLGTFTGREELRALVTRLTERMEAGREEPWAVADAPVEYVDRLCQAITGIEIRVERWEGKWKVSQNRPEKDRRSVAEALEGDPMGAAVKAAL